MFTDDDVEPAVRILFDVHPRIWGGTESFTIRLIRHLDPTRFDCHVYTSGAGVATTRLAKEHISFFTPPSDAIDEIALIRALLARLEIDIVQPQHLDSPLALAGKAAGKTVVWRIGGHVDEIMKDSPSADKTRALAVVGMLADHIVCVSDFLAGQFAQVRPPVPMSTIHNGVDVDRIAANHRNPPLRLGAIAVGSIGHIIPQKRHVDVLAAGKIVKSRRPDVQFFFFGAPYPSEQDRRHLQWLQRIAGEWGLESNLSIRHCEDDKYERYAQADMMVFPGLNEGCSNGILEAMALGLPVIAAASGGNPELIEHDKTGVLVPGASPERLAAAILSLSDDLQARERLGAAAQAQVRQQFGMSQCAVRYAQIYEALARN